MHIKTIIIELIPQGHSKIWPVTFIFFFEGVKF